MKYIQSLCLAFALTIFFMSFVVYGQLTQSNSNYCLLIRFKPVKTSVQAKVQAQTKSNRHTSKIQTLLNYINIPLEISYVKKNEQVDTFDTFLAFEIPAHKPQAIQTLSHYSGENLGLSFEEQVKITGHLVEIETPTLRHPEQESAL